MTPDELETFVRLKAFVMLANTFRFVRMLFLPLILGCTPKKNALEILKLKLRFVGPLALFLRIPGGRSLTTPSRLSSLPVVMLYHFGPVRAIVLVKKIPSG